MCRLTTVFEYKNETVEQAHHRVLKGNQFVTSGKVCERICKKTGEVEKKKATVKDVKGKHYTNLVIKQH